jgi:hypothetical protein
LRPFTLNIGFRMQIPFIRIDGRRVFGRHNADYGKRFVDSGSHFAFPQAEFRMTRLLIAISVRAKLVNVGSTGPNFVLFLALPTRTKSEHTGVKANYGNLQPDRFWT